MPEQANTTTQPLIVMGVQGCGKSTIGIALASAFGYEFRDGDDLHSDEAKAKMAAGIPLNDQDREPWLDRIGATIAQSTAGGTTLVVACSALKRTYRDALRAHSPELVFVHLDGTQELIAGRINARNHEFMPASLLDSQFATLERLGQDERGIVVNVADAPEQIVAEVAQQLRDV